METLSSFRKSITSKISTLFNSNYHLNAKKKYLHEFFKKEDLKNISIDGLDYFIIPKQYYIWKGISTNDKKNKNVDIDSKDTKNILNNLSSYFFADKDTASRYGTNRANDKEGGVDLQFKIIDDIVLLDISSINTIVTLFRYLKNIKLENLSENDYLLENYNEELKNWNKSEILKKKYITEDIFFEKKWKVDIAHIITDTLGNFKPNKIDGKLTFPNTPIKVERKSDEFSDQELVKLICGMKSNKINGWIYFKENQEDGNEIIFHDEILICNPYGYIEYIDYHKI